MTNAAEHCCYGVHKHCGCCTLPSVLLVQYHIQAPPTCCAARALTSLTRSSWMVQQMQPLDSATSCCPADCTTFCATSLSSMLRDAMSFTSTAMRCPAWFDRMLLSNVVLPAPAEAEQALVKHNAGHCGLDAPQPQATAELLPTLCNCLFLPT